MYVSSLPQESRIRIISVLRFGFSTSRIVIGPVRPFPDPTLSSFNGFQESLSYPTHFLETLKTMPTYHASVMDILPTHILNS